jgi:hypothetical protein
MKMVPMPMVLRRMYSFFVSESPNSFNASESSPEWRAVHQEMCKSYYLYWGHLLGPPLPCMATLLTCVVPLRRVFEFVLKPCCTKGPKSYLEANDTELEEYIAALFELIILDKSKFMPKKWWSLEVVSMSLMLHLQYSSHYDNGDQCL